MDNTTIGATLSEPHSDVKNTTRSDLRGGNAGMKQTAKQAPTGDNFSRDFRRQMLKQLIVDRMAGQK